MQISARLLSVILLTGLLAGCAGNDLPTEVTQSGYPYFRMSPNPPPEPYEQGTPTTNNPMQEVWRPGYWNFDGAEFVWIPGHFLPRPDPTAVWMPDRWEERTFGWVFVPGHWL